MTCYAEGCKDCGSTKDWYMVQDALWKAAGMRYRGFLCLSCLENRIGRALVEDDFKPVLVNEKRFTTWYNKFAMVVTTACLIRYGLDRRIARGLELTSSEKLIRL